MARKRLIKGANAARVEERIARVPADVSIFASLRAMEESAPSDARGFRAPPKGRAKPAAAKPAAQKKAAIAKKNVASEGVVEKAAIAPSKPTRIGPSDFSNAERDAIVRCCSDYRNHLPIYLLAVQKEVKVIDSVIAKCGAKKP